MHQVEIIHDVFITGLRRLLRCYTRKLSLCDWGDVQAKIFGGGAGSPLPSPPLFLLPPLEVGPLNTASGSGVEPQWKSNFVQIWHLVASILLIFFTENQLTTVSRVRLKLGGVTTICRACAPLRPQCGTATLQTWIPLHSAENGRISNINERARLGSIPPDCTADKGQGSCDAKEQWVHCTDVAAQTSKNGLDLRASSSVIRRLLSMSPFVAARYGCSTRRSRNLESFLQPTATLYSGAALHDHSNGLHCYHVRVSRCVYKSWQ